MSYFDDVSGLCQTPGPSGFEDPAAEKAARLLAPLVDELKVDRLGSVIGVRRCGKPGAKKVLLDAHLDEVGLIVTGHKEGFLQMRTLGGIDPRVLADRELTVLSDPPMLGVEQAEKAAPVGTPIVYREETFRLGESLIAGKSLDDRSCFAILLRTLELLKGEELDVDVAVLGSCFEETSGDGALVATFAQDPDCAIAVDVTFAKTHDDKDTGFELGSGPAVGIGPNCARWMVSLLKKAAAEEHIPWNPEVMAGNTGTNGWDMQVVREGVPVALVSLPLRYMHTPLEVVSEKDAEQSAQLLAAFLRRVGKEDALCWRN